MNWYKEVIKHIAENNIDLAIEKLKEIVFQFSFVKYEIEITMLENQFAELNKKVRLNIADGEADKKRIIYNLLLLAEEIKRTKNEKSGSNSNQELIQLLDTEIDEFENLNETLTKDDYSISDVIARNLKFLIKKGKYSLKDFIKLTNSTSDDLLTYLKGVEIPPFNFLIVVAKLYDLDVTYFFFPKYKGNTSFIDNDLFKWAVVDSMTEKRYFEFINDLDYFFYLITFEWAKGMQIIYNYLFLQKPLPSYIVYQKSNISKEKLNYLRDKLKWLEGIICKNDELDISEQIEYILSKMFSMDLDNLLIMYMDCHISINLEVDLKHPYLEFGWWRYLNGHISELKNFNTVEFNYD